MKRINDVLGMNGSRREPTCSLRPWTSVCSPHNCRTSRTKSKGTNASALDGPSSVVFTHEAVTPLFDAPFISVFINGSVLFCSRGENDSASIIGRI